MVATVLLCLISMTTFCACMNVVMKMSTTRLVPMINRNSGYSLRAKRLARGYTVFAFILLGLASMVGTVFAFIDLFQT